MQSFPVDLDPEQVIRWIQAEQAAAPSTFRITAWRATETQELPARKELRLGDEEREELSEIASLATLEIAPARASDGWRLILVVEDEVGPGVTEEDEAVEAEKEIDLDTFYEEFIRPGRGSVSIVAEADNAAAKARLTRLLHRIEQDRHRSFHPGLSR